MTDPCESCLRWSECNGVDIDACPMWRDRPAAQYEDTDDRDRLVEFATRYLGKWKIPPVEIAAMDLSCLEDKTESGLFEED